MRTDGPAAPAEENGAKHTDTRALLHYAKQIYRRQLAVARLDTRAGRSAQRSLQSAAPDLADKYDGVVDWAEFVASIGDKFNKLMKKAKRLGKR